jgi:hypothetical protein
MTAAAAQAAAIRSAREQLEEALRKLAELAGQAQDTGLYDLGAVDEPGTER